MSSVEYPGATIARLVLEVERITAGEPEQLGIFEIAPTSTFEGQSAPPLPGQLDLIHHRAVGGVLAMTQDKTVAVFIEHTDCGPEVQIGVVEHCEEGASMFSNDLWTLRTPFGETFDVDAADCMVIDAERLNQLRELGGAIR